ncbi:unnamed protein product, partial [Prorocentrum cordatum]
RRRRGVRWAAARPPAPCRRCCRRPPPAGRGSTRRRRWCWRSGGRCRRARSAARTQGVAARRISPKGPPLRVTAGIPAAPRAAAAAGAPLHGQGARPLRPRATWACPRSSEAGAPRRRQRRRALLLRGAGIRRTGRRCARWRGRWRATRRGSSALSSCGQCSRRPARCGSASGGWRETRWPGWGSSPDGWRFIAIPCDAPS